jgi:hypothetical protein
MKKYIIILLVTICSYNVLNGQVIQGKVVDKDDGSPLMYASLGLVNTPVGTITNEKGEFKLETRDSTQESTIRFSMIGYAPKTYTIQELTDRNSFIELEKKPIQLEEIIVTANSDFLTVGTTGFTPGCGVAGWGGDKFGQGHEIGIKTDLGETFVKLKKLSFRIYKQSFDSTMLRLHIRDLIDDQPNQELLGTNILFTFSNTTGWVEINLDQYDVFLKGEIVLSLEWIKVWGLNKKNMVKMNRSKEKTAVVLLSKKKNNGQTFAKRGVEAIWRSSIGNTPSIYLTVQ